MGGGAPADHHPVVAGARGDSSHDCPVRESHCPGEERVEEPRGEALCARGESETTGHEPCVQVMSLSCEVMSINVRELVVV